MPGMSNVSSEMFIFKSLKSSTKRNDSILKKSLRNIFQRDKNDFTFFFVIRRRMKEGGAYFNQDKLKKRFSLFLENENFQRREMVEEFVFVVEKILEKSSKKLK